MSRKQELVDKTQGSILELEEAIAGLLVEVFKERESREVMTCLQDAQAHLHSCHKCLVLAANADLNSEIFGGGGGRRKAR